MTSISEDKKYQIICGNSLEELPKIPDNSVDSIVCDPPYELGFMGKKWDASGIAYNVELWKECLRVLKPGGHLLAFGGTRTYHRMAVAIEDAGFEVRDMLEWVYACLSEDTEILTIDGWQRYNKAIVNNIVLCYNVGKRTFEFHKPTNYFIYENQHTAYRIQSDNTDQIVSRNHRVIVERGGKFIFKTAETLQRQENIPFLESLQSLPEAIYDFQSHASVEKRDLLARVQEQDISKKTETTSQLFSRKTLRVLWQAIQNKKGEAREVLLNSMQWKNKGKGFSSVYQEKSSQMDGRTQVESTRENDRRTKLGLERWSNLFQKARELLADKICQVSERVFGNGTERWLCYGASAIYGTETGALPSKSGSSASYQSQSTGQQDRKPYAISKQSGAQITRSTITPIEYKGKMWCVEVPTGAFVARRNGKIFITGNSGFPKSLNVGKAVKAKELTGGSSPKNLRQSRMGDNYEPTGQEDYRKGRMFSAEIENDNTKEEINNEWEGFGTALKPAHESVLLARKPLGEKTIVENCLKWGTGAIDIDGCRIPTSEAWSNKASSDLCGDGGWKETERESNTQGRFPANCICTDDALNDGVMTKSVQHLVRNQNPKENSLYQGGYKPTDDNPTYSDSGSKSRYFDIDVWGEKYGLLQFPKASKRERNEGCEGLEEKGKVFNGQSSNPSKEVKDVEARFNTQPTANHHPTVKPVHLMSWLVRLVTPKDGTCLDPFNGSGTTGVACAKLGINYIGIELDPEYYKISEARIKSVTEGRLL